MRTWPEPEQTLECPRASIGRDGRIVLPYKPIYDPRFRTRPRVHTIDVGPQAR